MIIKLILLFAISLAYSHGQIDCQLYRDRLFFGVDYPESLKPEVRSCADRRVLKHQLNRVLNIKINRTITKTNEPKFSDTIILLSPKETMHIYPKEWGQYKALEKMSKTMHLIKNTNIDDLIWRREGGFHTFSEIVYEFDEDIDCPNDIDANEFRVLDGRRMFDKEIIILYRYNNTKVIIIPVFKTIPLCLRMGVVNDKKTDDLSTLNDNYKNMFKFPNGTAFNPYFSSSTLYHTSLEAIYPNFYKIKDMETSTAPWIDEDLKRRNSTWCRSHRHILAFSELVFEFKEEDELIEIEATDPCFCSIFKYSDDGVAILMRFSSWDITLRAWIYMTQKKMYLNSLIVIRISDREEFRIDLKQKLHERGQTIYLQNQRFNKWNNRISKSCGAFHLRFGMFAVEYDDFGVGYNFSKSFAEMKKIHTLEVSN